jgi:hypothetical protein
MGDVAKQERQVEDVDVVYNGAERADADAGELKRPELRLLNNLLLAAQLHRRKHLHAEPALGRVIELLAEVLNGDDGRIALGVHVGGLQHRLRLGQRLPAKRGDAERQRTSRGQQIPPSHNPLPGSTHVLLCRFIE